jgi:hypothetical protein
MDLVAEIVLTKMRTVINRLDMIRELSNESHIKKICSDVIRDLKHEFFNDDEKLFQQPPPKKH